MYSNPDINLSNRSKMAPPAFLNPLELFQQISPPNFYRALRTHYEPGARFPAHRLTNVERPISERLQLSLVNLMGTIETLPVAALLKKHVQLYSNLVYNIQNIANIPEIVKPFMQALAPVYLILVIRIATEQEFLDQIRNTLPIDDDDPYAEILRTQHGIRRYELEKFVVNFLQTWRSDVIEFINGTDPKVLSEIWTFYKIIWDLLFQQLEQNLLQTVFNHSPIPYNFMGRAVRLRLFLIRAFPYETVQKPIYRFLAIGAFPLHRNFTQNFGFHRIRAEPTAPTIDFPTWTALANEIIPAGFGNAIRITNHTGFALFSDAVGPGPAPILLRQYLSLFLPFRELINIWISSGWLKNRTSYRKLAKLLETTNRTKLLEPDPLILLFLVFNQIRLNPYISRV